jgi:hypothetical protein
VEEEWLVARLEAGKRLEISHLACFVFLGYGGLCVENKLPR